MIIRRIFRKKCGQITGLWRETYQFKRKIAAFEKNYMYDTPLLCIAFSMGINDDEGDYTAIYTAFFDLDGNCFDDQLTT